MSVLQDMVREILAGEESIDWLRATGAMHAQMSAAEERRGLPARPSSRDEIHGVRLTGDQAEAYRAGFAAGSES